MFELTSGLSGNYYKHMQKFNPNDNFVIIYGSNTLDINKAPSHFIATKVHDKPV